MFTPFASHGFKVLTLLLLSLGLLSGCIEEREVSSSWDWLRSQADPKPTEAGQARRSTQGWAILLQRFEGENQQLNAYHFAAGIRESGQVADVWFTDVDGATAVYAGRFQTETDPIAKQTLASVKAASINGQRTLRKAKLVPLTHGRSGAGAAPYDLSQHNGYRTLLIAVFDPEHGSNFRRSAEQYAAQIRQKHEFEEVFFYHGPRQSLVTAGLFTYNDFETIEGLDHYGPRIKQMQALFPHTLKNGKTIPGGQAADGSGLEATVIVRVP